MDSLIHITINGQPFDLPKSLVEKFDFFKSIIEAQKIISDQSEDNIVISNPDISADVFKMLTTMLNNGNMIKEIIKMYDMLGYNDIIKYDLLEPYYCSREDCTNFKEKQNRFCNTHKCNCTINNCKNNTETGKYCSMHKCIVNNCDHKKKTSYQYCALHNICAQSSCNNFRAKGTNEKGYCTNHVCSCCPNQRNKRTNYCDNCYYGKN